jgi:hypothetical protein
MVTETSAEITRAICALVLLAAALPAGIAMGPAAAFADSQPLLTANQMVVADGRARFVLGLYENPKDDAALKGAVKAGFNLICSGADKASLDRLHAHGVKAWVNLGSNLDLSADAEGRKARLVQTVNSLKDHPALLIWEGPDEALWNVWYESGINYYSTTGFPAMDAAVEKARADKKPTAEIDGLARMVKQCREMFDRGLWAAFDAGRDEFWKEAGRPPRPEPKMADRADEARKVGEGITKGIQAVREADPRHLIWLNHAPRNSIQSMASFNRAADMAGCDIYPVPSGHEQGHSDLATGWLTSVGLYTERMRAAARGKSCVMVLQGFGWRDLQEASTRSKDPAVGRRPNYQESRFMAFEAIAHGANAVMYWGTAYIEKDSQLWKELLRLVGELSALEPALVAPAFNPAPEVASDETYGSVDGGGVRLMLKQSGEDYVLIAVNETPHGLSFEVRSLPAQLDGKTLHRLWTDESLSVKGGAFRDGIRGMDVHVYATSRRFEPRR